VAERGRCETIVRDADMTAESGKTTSISIDLAAVART
jgi:hypothetical protein